MYSICKCVTLLYGTEMYFFGTHFVIKHIEKTNIDRKSESEMKFDDGNSNSPVKIK